MIGGNDFAVFGDVERGIDVACVSQTFNALNLSIKQNHRRAKTDDVIPSTYCGFPSSASVCPIKHLNRELQNFSTQVHLTLTISLNINKTVF